MGGIGVVHNPRSGKNQRDPRAALRLQRLLGDHGVLRTVETLEDLFRTAEDFKKLGIDVLGISGGDGTNGVTISGFVRAYQGEPIPQLAFLRGGTFNTIANSLGVPRNTPDDLLDRVIRRYAARGEMPWIERNVMDVGGRSGFIFGTGAIYGYISEYNKSSHRNVRWAAEVLLKACADVARGRPTPVAARWEGRVLFEDGSSFPDRDYLAIGAGTVDQIGLGFTPFYRTPEIRDSIHVLGIHTSALGFVRKLPDVWRARPMGEASTYDRVTDAFVVEGRHGVVEHMLDGDVHVHRGPLSVRAGARVRIFLEPRQTATFGG
jgi:hypothetical protein